jgi:hypothetical protein
MGCIFLSSVTYAQWISTIKLSQDSCYVGDVVEAQLFLKVPESAGVEGLTFESWQEIQNKLYYRDTTIYDQQCDIDILDYGEWVSNTMADVVPIRQISIKKEDGFLLFTNTIKFAIYNQGRFELPSPRIICKDTLNRIASPGPVIEVLNPERVMQSDSLDINPIQDIIKEPKNWRDYLYLLWIIPILAIMWYIYQKRAGRNHNEKVETAHTIALTPVQIALQRLDQLREKQQWKYGDEVGFQVELTDIIKTFIKENYSIPATELTTSEIIEKLDGLLLSNEQKNNLDQIFKIADIIKFAKGHAVDDVHASFLDKAYFFILNNGSQ